jgi:hypothetical protein
MRCFLLKELDSGKYLQIYCHRANPELLSGYDTEEKVHALFLLGDLVELRRTVQESLSYYERHFEDWDDLYAKEVESIPTGFGVEGVFVFRKGYWFMVVNGVEVSLAVPILSRF